MNTDRLIIAFILLLALLIGLGLKSYVPQLLKSASPEKHKITLAMRETRK